METNQTTPPPVNERPQDQSGATNNTPAKANVTFRLPVSVASRLGDSEARTLFYALDGYKDSLLHDLVGSLVTDARDSRFPEETFLDASYVWNTIQCIDEIQREFTQGLIDLAEANYDAAYGRLETHISVKRESMRCLKRFLEKFDLKQQPTEAGGSGHE